MSSDVGLTYQGLAFGFKSSTCQSFSHHAVRWYSVLKPRWHSVFKPGTRRSFLCVRGSASHIKRYVGIQLLSQVRDGVYRYTGLSFLHHAYTLAFSYEVTCVTELYSCTGQSFVPRVSRFMFRGAKN